MGLQLRQDQVSLTEGRTGVSALQVRLTSQPAGDVQVRVSRAAGDSDITVVDPAVTLTRDHWDQYHWVRLTAAEDRDRINGSATIRFEADGMAPATAKVTERDNDRRLAIEMERVNGAETRSLVVPEGRTAALLVRLTAAPARARDVTVARLSGDRSLTVLDDSGHRSDPSRKLGRLTFTPANWEDFQWVLLGAGEDSDSADGLARFRISSPGLVSRLVTVRERDNDVRNRQAVNTVLIDDFIAQPLLGEQQNGQEFSYLIVSEAIEAKSPTRASAT
jgi:hypothetical protein